jgi:glucose-1-phosphate adenylyltransferase
MDLMKKEVRDELFNPQHPIYTKVRDDAPSKYGLRSSVKNSIIAQGCVIDGEVENCVISKGVYVGEGAKLSNCIVMQDTKIGKDTNLNYVIIDKDVTIKNERSLMGFESYPIYIAKKSVV